jgi:1-deoxy-D-xylulose-5-phosphate synthase
MRVHIAIRYPRGNGVMTEWKTPLPVYQTRHRTPCAQWMKTLHFSRLAPLAIYALKACEELEQQGIHAALYDMRFAKTD